MHKNVNVGSKMILPHCTWHTVWLWYWIWTSASRAIQAADKQLALSTNLIDCSNISALCWPSSLVLWPLCHSIVLPLIQKNPRFLVQKILYPTLPGILCGYDIGSELARVEPPGQQTSSSRCRPISLIAPILLLLTDGHWQTKRILGKKISLPTRSIF